MRDSRRTTRPTKPSPIRPILEALGWADYLPQQGSQRNEDIPDHLLFADTESKARAAGRGSSQERYLDALLIEESKRSGLPLYSRDPADRVQTSTPRLFYLLFRRESFTPQQGAVASFLETALAEGRRYEEQVA